MVLETPTKTKKGATRFVHTLEALTEAFLTSNSPLSLKESPGRFVSKLPPASSTPCFKTRSSANLRVRSRVAMAKPYNVRGESQPLVEITLGSERESIYSRDITNNRRSHTFVCHAADARFSRKFRGMYTTHFRTPNSPWGTSAS